MSTFHTLTRRAFLAAAAAVPVLGFAADPKPRCIVLRSGWQAINIGDVAHTPGALRLLERHLPQAEIVLWPVNATADVRAMLRSNFPKVKIVTGSLDANGKLVGDELKATLERADLVMHGSGPSVVSPQPLEWARKEKKPYGIYGVTLGDISEKLKGLLSDAAFLFCRDTDSLEHAKKSGVKSPVMEFGPDAVFALDTRDEEKAETFLKSAGLEPGKFLVAVPRLRYTPYKNRPEEEQKRRAEVSEKFAEVDHAKMREAMIAWVRQTKLKVVVCPEMTYALDVGQKLLVDPLPEDVKKHVVRRETFWLPDEALSVYARARGVVSFEMHSPIMAIAAGTPAIHLRQPTDTRKGQMMRDVGLGDWLFEIDRATGEEIAKAVVRLHTERDATEATLRKATEFLRKRQKETMAVVGRAAGVS